MAPAKRRKGKQGSSRSFTTATGDDDSTTTGGNHRANGNDKYGSGSSNSRDQEPPLVLTSDKRRGIYECDYCHADISQVPRIRCAVCPDFDLCLDCFATTDHTAAIARLKAAATAHDAANVNSYNSSISNTYNNNQNSTLEDGGGVESTTIPTSKKGSGVSAAAANHDDTHGYRVADSTRYPLFPSVRSIVPSSLQQQQAQNISNSEVGIADDKSDEAGGDKDEGDENETMEQNDNANKEDAMQVYPDEDHKGAAESDDTVEKTSSAKGVRARQVGKEVQDVEPEEADNGPQDEIEVIDPKDESDEKGDAENVLLVQEDPKSAWTIEEDLRLLDAIATCGLGNWADISEAIGGQGSTNKPAKRCMERYFDDFLGRYGHIVPPYTIVDDDGDVDESAAEDGDDDDDSSRPIKRRRTERSSLLRSQSSMSIASQTSSRSRRKVKVVPTSSLPGYDSIWPSPYVPPIPNVEIGQDVGRDQCTRAEQAYIKAISQLPTKEEADKFRKEWMETRLNQWHGPTVLPLRQEDIASMPGSELAGFMPRRGDFDTEWENDAETILADMEFSPNDLPQDRQLKIQVIEMYNSKLDERERRKHFLLSRNLLDYRKNQQADLQLPRDERDLVRRMRLFERLHTPDEHKQFVADLLKAKHLRKEIAKLQMYRRMGIRSLAEAEKFELDKNRREYHKMAQLQKESEAAKAVASRDTMGIDPMSGTDTNSLWKQYRTKDRKGRRSINRTGSNVSDSDKTEQQTLQGAEAGATAVPEGGFNIIADPESETQGDVSMVDTPTEQQLQQHEQQQAVGDSSTPEAEKGDSTNITSARNDDIGFDIYQAPGFELLSSKEVALCEKLHMLPSKYLEIKTALIHESLQRGLLDKEGAGSNRRSIVKIDTEKKGDVVDFMVRAGWISKVGAVAAVQRASAAVSSLHG